MIFSILRALHFLESYISVTKSFFFSLHRCMSLSMRVPLGGIMQISFPKIRFHFAGSVFLCSLIKTEHDFTKHWCSRIFTQPYNCQPKTKLCNILRYSDTPRALFVLFLDSGAPYSIYLLGRFSW